jgi:hypothetical protein
MGDAMTRLPRVERWAMLCIVPFVAMSVAARQLYLHNTEDLSTWKGGGMGMFAAADNTLERFAKVYLLLPNGQRQPLLRLTEKQEQLKKTALLFPSERNFRALADSIRATTWWASTDRVPLNIFDENGHRARDGNEHYYDLYPAHPRTSSESLNWGVEIEYWKTTYDPKTANLTANLARTFTFKD